MSFENYPLHRLNSGHVRAWLFFPQVRRFMASWLGKTYRTGCVVLSPTLRAFALVSPTGIITELPPPHKQFQFWQLANKPSAKYGECACRNFWDSETQGPWGERDKERAADIHHWACQARQVAVATWNHAFDHASARVAEGKNPEPRPDAWIKKATELENGG